MPRIKKIKDYETFKDLVHLAIGDSRTQSGFAESAGISKSQISKMLSGPDAAVPTIETLSRIAGHAAYPVTLRSLMNACGYPENVVEEQDEEERKRVSSERENYDPQKRTFALAEDFLNVYSSRCGEKGFIKTESPIAWLTYIQENEWVPEDFTFEGLTEACDYDGEDYEGAEQALPVMITYETKDYAAGFVIILMFCTTKAGQALIFGISFTPELAKSMIPEFSISAMPITNKDPNARIPEILGYITVKEKKKGFLVSEEERENRLQERYDYYRRFKGMDKNEALMAAMGLVDDKDRMHRPACGEGPGIWLDTVSPKKAFDFLMNHEKEYVNPEKLAPFYELARKTDYRDQNVWDWFEENSYETDLPHSYVSTFFGSAIAEIIYYNTGISLISCDDTGEDEEFPYSLNRPVIYFSNEQPWFYTDTEKQLTRQSLVQILDGYALELGTEVCDVFYYYSIDLRK